MRRDDDPAARVVFALGLALFAVTLTSAVKTFVLPRSATDGLTCAVFLVMRRVFHLRLRSTTTYAQRDRIMAFYAPVTLLALLPTWLILVWIGYAGMFWAVGVPTWYQAFRDSGSSLLTLGFEPAGGSGSNAAGFLRGDRGFDPDCPADRLLAHHLQRVPAGAVPPSTCWRCAGKPPSAVEMIERYHRIHGLDRLDEQWRAWEAWFADIEEGHTSLAALVFFRSPRPDHSWITAAGAVLEAAALSLSALDIPYTPRRRSVFAPVLLRCAGSPTLRYRLHRRPALPRAADQRAA